MNILSKKTQILILQIKFLLWGGCRQAAIGSPVKPGRQEQVGAWLITLHSAFIPHVPGQGSLHLLFIQALLRSQSLLTTHSGLQPVYGSPKYSDKHAQDPAPFRSLHIAFAPHGDGLQGSLGVSVGGARRKIMKRIQIVKSIQNEKNSVVQKGSGIALTLFNNQGAPGKRISCVSRNTTALRIVFNDTACSLRPTRSRAWISTLFILTC